jgi:hypothetical protein
LNYHYDRSESVKSLGVDLSNARKPSSGPDRENAVKIISYMRKNRLADLAALADHVRDRWKSLEPVREELIRTDRLQENTVAEGKVKLFTDPDYFGAEVDDAGFDRLPVINIPTDQLVGFEPDAKMNQPRSRANVRKILAGLKRGDSLPPVLVRKYKNGYQVLDGHHRFWAYKVLGIKSIPSQIVPARDIEVKGKQGVAENFTFDQPRRELNIPALIKRGAIFITHPHGPGGWETDRPDWDFSLITLQNVLQRSPPWVKDYKKYIKPLSFKKATPELFGKLSDQKYNQILWSIQKLNIPEREAFLDQAVQENFADGKKPGRRGLAKRMGVPTKASVSKLRKIARSSSGEKQRMAHWLANMKSGRKKSRR